MGSKKYQCPQCHSDSHRIDVEATVRAALIQAGTENVHLGTEHADEKREQWDDDSPAWCCECGYNDVLGAFRVPQGGVVVMHAHRCPETDAPLFWSNQDGWVDLRSATVFEASEEIRLPNEAWGLVELPAERA